MCNTKEEILDWINETLDTKGKISITDVDNKTHGNSLLILNELYQMDDRHELKSELVHVDETRRERVFTRNENS